MKDLQKNRRLLSYLQCKFIPDFTFSLALLSYACRSMRNREPRIEMSITRFYRSLYCTLCQPLDIRAMQEKAHIGIAQYRHSEYIE